jgi:hypothetical protein
MAVHPDDKNEAEFVRLTYALEEAYANGEIDLAEQLSEKREAVYLKLDHLPPEAWEASPEDYEKVA